MGFLGVELRPSIEFSCLFFPFCSLFSVVFSSFFSFFLVIFYPFSSSSSSSFLLHLFSLLIPLLLLFPLFVDIFYSSSNSFIFSFLVYTGVFPSFFPFSPFIYSSSFSLSLVYVFICVYPPNFLSCSFICTSLLHFAFMSIA